MTLKKGKKPEWLNKKIDFKSMKEVGSMLRSLNLNTVCEGAKCPNMGECFRNSTATFMILGNICTRNCMFCAVPTGKTTQPDSNEPENLAKAAKKLKLKHVVITSVTRDDLADGGAKQFANCIKAIREHLPTSSIEVLIPDMQGDTKSLDIVINAQPNILNHNIETVPNLYKDVRPMANYNQSLFVLDYTKTQNPKIYTKSGIMIGLGENLNEVIGVLDDLRKVNCDMLTIGQYLPPSHNHAILKEYIHPDIFKEYKEIAIRKGFRYVASGPYVRSSYNAVEGMTEVS